MTNNKIYFIANWKMYGTLKSVQSLKNVIKLKRKRIYKKAKIVYCPPYTLLGEFSKSIRNTDIELGAQNCHYNFDYGAYTGSVNSKMIKNIGCKYVIIGHSENRVSGENDKVINLKIKSSISEKLKVIFCIGETLKEKRKKITSSVLKRQISKGLKNIKNYKKILIAYEPVWSIGSGIIPKDAELELNVRKIKKLISKKTKYNIPILYGGSVNSINISRLKNMSRPILRFRAEN